jgi:GR25 family glycosyltransferase involved in LPS biosynthesis
MTNINNSFDFLGKKHNILIHTYVINLKRRKDRKKLIIQKFKKANFHDYEFFEAVDGYDKSLNNLYQDVKNKYTSKGALGLTLTYINLLEDAYQKNYDKILILEDDVNFHKNYQKIFEINRSIIFSNEYDIIWLGANQEKLTREQMKTIKENSYYIPCPSREIYTYGTYSIILNKNCIKKIRDKIKNEDIKKLGPIDNIINEMIKFDVLKGIVCRPFLFLPDVTESDNMGTRNQELFCKTRHYQIQNYDYVSVNDIINVIKNNDNNSSEFQKSIERIKNLISDDNEIQLLLDEINDT